MRSMTRDKYSPTRSISSGYGYNYGGGGGGSGTSPAQSIDRLSTMSALPSTDYISRHHTTPSSAGGGGGGESLSGSRASLDSRASSTYSAVSHQPVSGVVGSRYNNNNNSGGGVGGGSRMANTLGRTSGSAFMRQANERRSLRLTPTSPPPSPLIAKPAPIAIVQLTPISNNRASALRASLRMKNPFSNLSASFQPPVASQPQLKVHKPTPQTAAVAPSSSSSSSTSTTNKRPTVLQLFTSAFSRPSPASSTKNLRNSSQSATPPMTGNNMQSSANNNPSHYQSASSSSTTSLPYYTSPYQQQQQQQQQNSNNKGGGGGGGGGGQGRRSEPEGVESKLMTASCFTNPYTTTAAMTPKSPVPPPRTIKPSRYTHSIPFNCQFSLQHLLLLSRVVDQSIIS